MGHVNNPQTWMVIGIFATILPLMYAMMRDLRKSIVNELRADLGADIRAARSDLGAEIQALRSDLGADIQAVRADLTAEIREFKTDTARRFDNTEHRLDAIESDMTIIKGALIGRISA